ncbi:hypothetical protein CC2G_007699 [Coprinopsis cinerea AmutBmut pab1-1]|nr:hypothetical protein CC2G_007699 [Coprinopsis cinerea AmutBmut pab1-1]
MANLKLTILVCSEHSRKVQPCIVEARLGLQREVLFWICLNCGCGCLVELETGVPSRFSCLKCTETHTWKLDEEGRFCVPHWVNVVWASQRQSTCTTRRSAHLRTNQIRTKQALIHTPTSSSQWLAPPNLLPSTTAA